MSEEIKNLLQKQNEAFSEYKKTNDQTIAEVKKHGEALGESQKKLADLDAELNRISDELKAVAKQAARPPAPGDESKNEDRIAHRKGILGYLRKGSDAGLRELEAKALNTQSDPDGGYFLSTEIEAGIETLAGETSALYDLADVRTTSVAVVKKRVRKTGAGYGWHGEGEVPNSTNTQDYALLEFPHHTIFAYPEMTMEALEDTDENLEQELQAAIVEAFSEGIGEAIVSGDGVKRPRGLLSYGAVANANYAWGKLGYVASGKSGDFAEADPADKLIDLVHALKRGYRQNASFLMNDLTLAKVRKFKDENDNYLWQPSLQAGVPGLLLGYACHTDDFMPDLGSGSLSIAFGDFKRGYRISNKRGIAVLRDPFTSPGYVKFFTTRRIGGGVQNFEAIKLMKFASS